MFDAKMIKQFNKNISKMVNNNFNHLNNFNDFNSSKKHMNYPQAFFKYGLNPFGDADRDGVSNVFDCRPFNRFLQDMTGYIQDDEGNVLEKGPMKKIARKHFGTTEDFLEVGYIMPSGEMLDFSGKKFGGMGHERSMDHRQIHEVMIEQSGGEAMTEFQKEEGAVRFSKFRDGDVRVDAVKKPTPEQARRIGEAITTHPRAKYVHLERTDEKGYTVEDLESEHPHPVLVQKFISKAFKKEEEDE